MDLAKLGMTKETLDALKSLQLAPGDLAMKAFTTGLGYVWYNLDPVVKSLFPVITPLRNSIPRKDAGGGTAVHWKAVTGINTQGLSIGVSEGNRNAATTTQLQDYTVPFAELGLEDYVTFKSERAAQNLTPEIKAEAVKNLLWAVMIGEERIILGGNSGALLPLGTVGTVTAAAVAGGSMTAQAWKVFCVALTPEGQRNSSVLGGVPILQTRVNMDGSQDQYGGGSSQVSAAASVTTSGGNLSIGASTPTIKGAAAYAWFFGTLTNGTDAILGQITSINSVLQTVNTAAGTAAPTGYTVLASGCSSDQSGNDLIFDGIPALSLSSNGLYVSQATGTNGTGTTLTADNAGGIAEIEADLEYYWDNFRMMPNRIIVNAQEMKNINNKIIAGGTTPLYRINLNGDEEKGQISAGSLVRDYLGKFAMQGGVPVKIQLHPDQPRGQILYVTDQLPYPTSNVSDPLEMAVLEEYRQIDWPITKRRWEYGVYMQQALKCLAPFAFGVRDNIANG